VKKPCCPEDENSADEQLTVTAASCCGSKIDKPAASTSCCDPTGCTDKHAHECPECVSGTSQNCCDKPKTTQPGVRWIVSIFAQKCRGEGPVGPLQLAPTVLPNVTSQKIANDQPAGYVVNVPIRVTFTSHPPPTPPPRCS
jgi:hypothetical protein